MSNRKEYGGYLQLELPLKKEYFYDLGEENIVRLNCGRSTFWYVLKILKPKKLYVPYLNCINSTDPATSLGIPFEYYRLEDDLTPKDVLVKENEAIIWVNYYGNATEEQIKKVVDLYKNKNLIIDNCHAFFSKPIRGVYNCYSTRKFFGVPDGAYLVFDNVDSLKLSESNSSQYCTFLLSSIEKGTDALYPENLYNEYRIGKTVARMSKLTRRILQSIDYEEIRSIRKANLLCLHKYLGEINEFSVNLEVDTHIHYPLLVYRDDLRQKLVNRNIYTPMWWKHVPSYFTEEVLETKLSKYMVMLPIDQRYNAEDMKCIANIVLEEYSEDLQ